VSYVCTSPPTLVGTKNLQIMEHNLTPAQMQQYLAIVNEVERYRDLSEEEKENLIQESNAVLWSIYAA